MVNRNYDQQALLLAVLASGVFFGLLIGFVFGWFVWDDGGFLAAANEWQTLIGALIAFFASFMLFLSAVYSDIRSRQARLSVARAFLSHSLSDLSSYVNGSLDFLFEVLANFRRNNYDPRLLEHSPPSLENAMFNDIRTVIEFSDGEAVLVLKSLISDLQVINSRIRNICWSDGRNRATGIDERYVYSCVYYLSIIGSNLSKLYDYSRKNSRYKYDPITYSNLNSVLRTCGFGLHFLANQDLDGYIRSSLERRDSSMYGAFG